MNSLLLSEISAENVDPIHALLLLEEYIFARKLTECPQIMQIIARCQQAIDNADEPLLQIECFIETLFIDELFIDQVKNKWPVSSYQLSDALAYRSLAPALKVMLIQYIANACNFQTDVVFIPETLMVRIICDDEYAVIFDPVTGEALEWQELDLRLDDIEGDPLENYLSGENNNVLLRHYLTALKNALIDEQQFHGALKCVDMLLAMKPNDPFERRDRGFLLHQLDCFKVACDDYRYFVEHCPKDPAAQLLKIQLDNITITTTILH